MGFLDALGGGIQQAAQGVSDTMGEKIKSQIELERQQAMAQFQEELRQKGRASDDAFAHDPSRVARNRDEKVADAEAVRKSDLDFNTQNAEQIGKNKGAQEVAELVSKATPAALKAARAIAEANENPTQRRLQMLQIQEAELKLKDASTKSQDATDIRNYIGARDIVDDTQPGAQAAKDYYTGLINKKAEINSAIGAASLTVTDRQNYVKALLSGAKDATAGLDPTTAKELTELALAQARAGGSAQPTKSAAADLADRLAPPKGDAAKKPSPPPEPEPSRKKASAVESKTSDAKRLASIEAKLTAADSNKFEADQPGYKFLSTRLSTAERRSLELERDALRAKLAGRTE